MKGRFSFLYLLLIGAFGVLLFRLFDLTVARGSYHRALADEQRIKLYKITAPRGVIFDRKGKPLVRNIPIYKKCPASGGGQISNVKCQIISREEALILEAAGRDADLDLEVGREYLYSESMAHLLGYLGEATEEEVRNGKWEAGSLVGRTGIEEQYQNVLPGIDGGELVEVDTYGLIARKMGKTEPVPGKDLFLSIDADLQKAAYEAIKGERGAVVAADPGSGQILALVSSPSFDPNNLTEESLSSPAKPMFNRAIGGAYPPGSTFKIVTSAAALEEGKINAQTKIEDPGQIVIGQYHYANWYFTKYGKTEGVIGLVRAIARSTDTFFYKVGEFVGATKLVKWGKAFGLGKASGIDLPGEISGFLPDPSEGNWFLGNTYHLSIGQGALGLTPLQVNQMTGVIASRGKLCRPRINITNKQIKNDDCQEVGLKEETIDLIREGMKEACSPGGTTGIFFNFSPPGLPANWRVACKTGTAEFGDPAGRTHAWLTAFVLPDEALAKSGAGPIVVTALVEAGGEGSTVAAPIVKKVLEDWFKR